MTYIIPTEMGCPVNSSNIRAPGPNDTNLKDTNHSCYI